MQKLFVFANIPALIGCYYIMGIREKTWKKYDKDGTVIMTVSYKDDLEDRVNGIKVNLPERNVKLIR